MAVDKPAARGSILRYAVTATRVIRRHYWSAPVSTFLRLRMLLGYSAFGPANSTRRQVELIEVAVILRNHHHRGPGAHQFGQKLVIEFAPEFRILFRRPFIQQEDRPLLEQAHDKRQPPALPA